MGGMSRVIGTIQLHAVRPAADTRHFLSQLPASADPEPAKRSIVTITRTGEFSDPRYGKFEITPALLAQMVRNFEARTIGDDVFIDVSHKPEDGAAAKVLSLRVEGNRLRAEIEWTDFGVKAVKERGFRYLSAEYVENYRDNEKGDSHGAVLLGAGLTVRPVIKRLDPVVLSEDFSRLPVLLHPELVRHLSETVEITHMNWLTKLRTALLAISLSEAVVTQLCDTAKTAAAGLGEDEAKLKTLSDSFLEAGKKLAAQIGSNNATIQLSVNAPGGLSADDVQKAITKALADDSTKRETETKRLAEAKAAAEKAFDETLAAAKGLGDDTRKSLAEARGLITAETTVDQAKKLAEHQVSIGQKLEATRQLASQGFPTSTAIGVAHITVDDSNTIRKLSCDIRAKLRTTATADQLRRLNDDATESPFVAKALALFDAQNAERLHSEAKMLAGGPVNTGDMSLPASYQREVIRQSLSDLQILSLARTEVDATNAATHTIPYETRDVSAVYNTGVVYEGQPIHKAGIAQANDFAYIVPTKLALELTNEAMHFSRMNGNINWDAYARNVESNARYQRELIARRIANEYQRSSACYGAVQVTAEAFDAQLTGTRHTLKLANFPIVRPHQVRDLRGNAVGSPECPITLTLNGVVLSEYDGTNTQGAGTYFRVVSYNLGYIQLVNQLGVAQTPTDTGTNTITYWRETNIKLVDIDVPGGSYYERHMNKILQGVGEKKADLQQDRYAVPDFVLSSATLNNVASDAENFSANFTRNATALNAMGAVSEIKALPVWETNAPAIDLGEERLLIGVRGTLAYTIAKPFAIGAPFELTDSSGRALGKKAAYGEEYSSIKVPTPIRERLTSVLAYSAAARTAFTGIG
jgi:hypothetical protein